MNIAVDYGNTTAKVGVFDDGILNEKFHFRELVALQSFLRERKADHIIVSSVSVSSGDILSSANVTGKKISLSPNIPLPVRILYSTPQTLGVDRIAAVCGALELFSGKDCLVIDAGTCITYEFLDREGNYHGGGISPGIAMRFEAMHQLTARLPIVKPVIEANLVGNSTETSMQSGVMLGTRMEVDGIVAQYKEKYPAVQVLLCGGDIPFFENHLKAPIFVSPDLVLIGLNRILRHVSSR